MGDVEAWTVEAVAAHHAAYGVADELFHYVIIMPYYMLFVCIHLTKI